MELCVAMRVKYRCCFISYRVWHKHWCLGFRSLSANKLLAWQLWSINIRYLLLASIVRNCLWAFCLFTWLAPVFWLNQLCTLSNTLLISAACKTTQFQCDDGTCISAAGHCDGLHTDCADASDEKYCTATLPPTGKPPSYLHVMQHLYVELCSTSVVWS